MRICSLRFLLGRCYHKIQFLLLTFEMVVIMHLPLFKKIISWAALTVFCSSTVLAGQSITLGVTAGPHAQIAEAVVKAAKENGLTIKIIEFSDGVLINEATDKGEIDANAFQHTPYLDQHVKDRNLDVISVASTVLLPSAVYSSKYKNVEELPTGALVSIPNDPTNAGRALKILDEAKVIRLKEGVSFDATELDIVENPKKIRILSLDSAQLPRSLEDVDLAVIPSYIALNANLLPSRDSILIEGSLSDYFCLIGVAQKNADAPWVPLLIKSYRSPEVKAFIATTFDGNIITDW